MFKVRISDTNTDDFFDTEMPKLPEKGDLIGFYVDENWVIGQVDYFVYEFGLDNDYQRVEINVDID